MTSIFAIPNAIRVDWEKYALYLTILDQLKCWREGGYNLYIKLYSTPPGPPTLKANLIFEYSFCRSAAQTACNASIFDYHKLMYDVVNRSI